MEKNKTGKYLKYAIGEIVLVMIGILLALQVSDWNQDRKDRISERKILNNIHRDFIQNKVNFDSVKVINYKSLAALDSITSIPAEGRLTIERYVEYDQRIKVITYNAYSSTVDAVINSNLLELIQDEELQKFLVSWKDVLIDFTEDENFYIKFLTEQYQPFMINNADWKGKNIEMNNKVLSSIKFHNHQMMRRNKLQGVITAIKEEPIENHINEIIRLTQPTD
ncbi:hypothetical protein [Polaribacter litorisediminis]|uniref:hypothetical protein n=1 Tax=Polaribacter litorisediminis TaxID=1908341 RepID=UPI001CC197AF|nr:hypothetical protein [Polaribacter litorisediminis]